VHAYGFGRGAECCERGVAIMQEKSWRFVLRERFAQLLCRPRRRRMSGHRDVDEATSLVRQDDQHEQQAEGHSRNHEEIGRHDLAGVVGQKRAPRLRRWASPDGQEP
jgi:hypothetical protein